MSNRDALPELISTLKQQRDELQLHMHLAKSEAKQEFERLTDRINELTDQYEPVRKATAETADNVIAALTLAAEEMKAGFERVRKSLETK